jgi:hypothetical protein
MLLVVAEDPGMAEEEATAASVAVAVEIKLTVLEVALQELEELLLVTQAVMEAK